MTQHQPPDMDRTGPSRLPGRGKALGEWLVPATVLLVGLLLFWGLLRIGMGPGNPVPPRVSLDPFWTAMNKAASPMPGAPIPVAGMDPRWTLRSTLSTLLWWVFLFLYARTLHGLWSEPYAHDEEAPGCLSIGATLLAWTLYVWAGQYHRLTPNAWHMWWFGLFASTGFPMVWARLIAPWVRGRLVRQANELAAFSAPVAARVQEAAEDPHPARRLAEIAGAEDAPADLRQTFREVRSFGRWLFVLPSVLVMWLLPAYAEIHLARLARWGGDNPDYYVALAEKSRCRPPLRFQCLLAAWHLGAPVAAGEWLSVAAQALDRPDGDYALAAFCKAGERHDAPHVRLGACVALLKRGPSAAPYRDVALDAVADESAADVLGAWVLRRPGRVAVLFDGVVAEKCAAAADRLLSALRQRWDGLCAADPATSREPMRLALSFVRRAHDIFASPAEAGQIEESWAADYVVRHRADPEGYLMLADAVRRRQPATEAADRRVADLARTARRLDPAIPIPDPLAKVLVLRGRHDEMLWVASKDPRHASGPARWIAWFGRHLWLIVLAAVVWALVLSWRSGKRQARPDDPCA